MHNNFLIDIKESWSKRDVVINIKIDAENTMNSSYDKWGSFKEDGNLKHAWNQKVTVELLGCILRKEGFEKL